MPKNPHADFTPALEEYSGQGTFRFWCQMALPLTYDDSLSYYELLCKVVNYLNHTIEDVANAETNVSRLAEAYTQLQIYVNDYFDDLDIEAELRNVLDAMAEDGTLDDHLDPLVQDHLPSVVDEQIDDVVADQIDDAVASQIEGVVAEQLPPLVDEGIPDEVTDWLAENVNPVGSAVVVDSSLTISGAAADAKVTGDKLTNLKTQITEQTVNLANVGEGRYGANNSGVISSTGNNNFGLAKKVPVSPSTTYVARIFTTATAYNLHMFYYDDDTLLDSEVGTTPGQHRFTTSADCNYVYFFVYNSGGITVDENTHCQLTLAANDTYVYVAPTTAVDREARENDDVYESVIENTKNINIAEDGRYALNTSTGNIRKVSDNKNWGMNNIVPCKPSTKYIMTVFGVNANLKPNVAYYDSNKAFIEYAHSDENLKFALTTPATCYYFAFALYGSTGFDVSDNAHIQIEEGEIASSEYMPPYTAIDIKARNIEKKTVNLIDVPEGRYGANESTGVISATNNNYFGLSKKIPVTPGTDYVVRCMEIGNLNIHTLFYEDETYINHVTGTVNREYKFTTAQNCNFVYFFVYNSGGVSITNYTHFQLMLAENDTPIYYPPNTEEDNILRAKFETAGKDNKIIQKLLSARYLGGVNYGNTKLFTMLHFSDLHASAINLKRIQKFIDKYKDDFDIAFCTGDMVSQKFSDGFGFWDENSDGEIFTCIGNHDVWTGTGDFDSMVTQQQAYERYFAPYATEWGITIEENKTYYYKDFSDYGIRMIVINCMLVDTDEVSAQNTWLQSTLASTPEGYSVLGISHYQPPASAVIQSNFTSIVKTPDRGYGINTDYLASVHSWIENGGEFIAWIGGHAHFDSICYNETYTDQPCILITTASATASNSDMKRSLNNEDMVDCFNIMAIDTTNKKIKIFRVGADFDMSMRYRRSLYFDYSTKTVVYND